MFRKQQTKKLAKMRNTVTYTVHFNTVRLTPYIKSCYAHIHCHFFVSPPLPSHTHYTQRATLTTRTQ